MIESNIIHYSFLIYLAPNLLATAKKPDKLTLSPQRGFFRRDTMKRIIQTYIHEAIEELHHVRWPTRQQAIRLSIIVIIFVAATSVSFGILDFGLSQVVKMLLSFAF